jgi:hypothetical protein
MSEQVATTKGPWKIGDGHKYGKWCAEIEANTPDGDFVCSIVEMRGWEANARLIAAAPELLEACELLLKHCEKTPSYSIEVAYYAARRAIAKAKG